ncbi:MAG: exopolyphosphatase / guanosine-5-triphosphate,3-diphosphate pyrophosphatase [Acidimicrobiaceae bacterium]|nr:exopolyphosphatase / guanosine-5-triphosphate,3-diphosphate pyrophosphatase [Acidimicrobiaceae bacterium]
MDSGRKQLTAVIDLGSNSFRLVVFTAVAEAWWRRTDEIYEPVRIGAGMGDGGPLKPRRMERALHTIEMFAHFLRASGLESQDVRAVATSAIREAANRDEFLERARAVAGFDVRVLSQEEEARYGYLAAINSTTLDHGAVLDLGGGSLQAVRVDRRLAQESASWRLGTVRMTEAYLDDEPATKKQLKALRGHVREELERAPWLSTSGERLVGLGGTVRNVAAAAQHRAGLPSFGVQGFVLERDALAELTADLAALPAAERGSVRGIKPERGDVILAGAATIEAVIDAGGFEAIEVTEEGLREGIFFETYLAPADPPLFASVRESSVRNLATQYTRDLRHPQHVAALTLHLYDSLAAAGAHPGDAAERELVWAAALLHDIGYAVDYDDHHKHSRYLILNAGLPGWTPREVALIALIARYHRKGSPSFGELAPLMEDGDHERLVRGSALVRLAEQLERSRDQLVREARVEVQDGTARLELVTDGDASVARWGAERQADLFESAFGRRLEVGEP